MFHKSPRLFEKLSYSWQLMGASWNVLKRDKALVLFPLLSGICCLLVIASFVAPIFALDLVRLGEADLDEPASAASNVLYYAYLFAFYFVNYFVITFFNVGITACAVSRMAGGEPTVGRGLAAAFKRIHLIAGWALFSATVGMILRMISERSGLLGRIVVSLLGAAWSLLTFLVVPILVVEDKGPFDALKSSSALLKRSWGEQVVGNFSFGLVFFLLTIPALLAIFFGLFFAAATSPALGFTLAGTAVVYLVCLSLVHSALVSIFQAAVYMYTQGVTDPDPDRGFPVQLLRSAMQ